MLGVAASGAGRGLAPHLKQLVGAWFMAQHDLQPEVAKEAAAGFAATFPGAKAQGAVQMYQDQACHCLVARACVGF